MKFDGTKAVLFDLDGTLLDTLDDLTMSLYLAMRHFGVRETCGRDKVRQYLGNGIDALVARALPLGTEDPHFAEIVREMRATYSVHCTEMTRPYSGIERALLRLKEAGLRLAVISNKPDRQVKYLCKYFFPGLLSGAAGGRPDVPMKPQPDALFDMMQALGVSPDDTVYVGDSEVDIETARNAGIPCVSVLWGFRSRETLIEAGAGILAEKPKELAALFCTPEQK